MNLQELKDRIDALPISGGRPLEDYEVCIPNNKVAWGGTQVTKVRAASRGSDWDNYKFFIWPETEMIEMPKDK